jgi:putative pyruvate formate lyase activating enzyme
VSPIPAFPSYLSLLDNGELDRRAALARELLADCTLCGRRCRANRLRGVTGAACRTGDRAVVNGHHPHFGEETVLRGRGGSGTIFFSWCNLRCVFCQNWRISQAGEGEPVGPADLAARMIELQETGCHNVNLVSPSHVVPQILAAVAIAARRGLGIPLVYNTGGYDSIEALSLLDGVVDIYLPDLKFGDSAAGRLFGRVRNYSSVSRAAVKEMHRQVGDLVVDESGIARRGLLVRHLVLPGGVANTARVLKFIATEISRDTYVNLMDQYRPAYRSAEMPPLDRPPAPGEIERALRLADKHGLRRVEARRPPPALLLPDHLLDRIGPQ